MIYDQAHALRAADLGLLRVSGESCPRILTEQAHDESCLCLSSANDHGGTYRQIADDSLVVQWEPYEMEGAALADLIADAVDDGLRVSVHGDAAYSVAALRIVFRAGRETRP